MSVDKSDRPQSAPLAHVQAFEKLRNVTIDYNRKRVSRRRRKELEEQARDLRRELGIAGYSPKAIYNVEMGLAGVPMPEPEGS